MGFFLSYIGISTGFQNRTAAGRKNTTLWLSLVIPAASITGFSFCHSEGFWFFVFFFNV